MSRKINLFLASAFIVMATTTTNTTLLGNAHAQESTYGPVKPGELIWNIAGKVTPNASVSRQQVIMGILHANPPAFKVSCNFNSLKVGEKLTIPALADIQSLSQEEAKKEFDRQTEAWKTRKKNPIVCPTPEATPTSVATPATPTSPSAPKPAEATPPKETPPAPPVTPKPSDLPTGAQSSPPAPTPPPTAPPVVAITPAVTAPVPPAGSPPPEAPKLVSENAASPPPVAPTNSTLPVPPAEVGATPPASPSSSPPKTPSQLPDLIIWFLIGGGLLSAFIIAGLLHSHAKQEASMSVSPDPNNYDFTRETKSIPDHQVGDMPLQTDKKADRSEDVIKE